MLIVFAIVIVLASIKFASIQDRGIPRDEVREGDWP